jgi:Tfp pilus assembly protein PilF
MGDQSGARVHIDTALALDPSHRDALRARAELDANEPDALITDKLALVASAPIEERAALLAESGDIYANRLGDPVSAREMYRDALTYCPTDHVLLNKCLGLIAEQGDWAESSDMLQRLIDTEEDPKVRAKYRHVAATILNEELHRTADAVSLLRDALEEDPTLTCAARELEDLLRARGDSVELAHFYYERLQRLRGEPGFADECTRLWGEIADAYLSLGQREEALCALEVATNLDPHNARRRQRLAKLYVELGPEYHQKAIAQHQALLRDNQRRVSSYHSLRGLYRLTGQPEKESACADALAIIGMRAVDQPTPTEPGNGPPFDADGPVLDRKLWAKLANGDVDRALSILFSIASPLFARSRARTRQQLGLRRKHRVSETDARRFAPILRAVARRLRVELPEVYVRREQPSVCALNLCASAAGVSFVLSLGRPVLDDDLSDGELAFAFARCLCDLRAERAARLIFRGHAELAQLIEAALGIAARNEPGIDHPASGSATSRSLEKALAPLELDQVATIGVRLHERGVEPRAAAQGWLDATERVAARVGFALAGDLRACVHALTADPSASESREELILDLVSSSVAEEMFDARRQLDPEASSRVRGQVSGTQPGA